MTLTFGPPHQLMRHDPLPLLRVALLCHTRRTDVLPITHLGVPHKLSPAVVRPLLPRAVLALLALLGRLLLPVRQLLDAKATTGLVVTVNRSLDVFDGVQTSSITVYLVYEGVCDSLVVGTEKSREEVFLKKGKGGGGGG